MLVFKSNEIIMPSMKRIKLSEAEKEALE